MKRQIIIANWKCNPIAAKEAKELFDSVKEKAKKFKKTEIIICPPFIYLSSLKADKSIKLGAQNCFWEDKGAYTGEVSALMVKDLKTEYVISGHSERRKYFNETDGIVNKKLKAILNAGLIPVFCIGETQEERYNNQTEDILKKQISLGLEGISANKFPLLIIAYEPIWAIGTGNPCDAKEAQKMRLFIKDVLEKNYNSNTAEETMILYGGSVNSENSSLYIKQAGFNGLLVGGASLNAEEFIKIIKQAL